MSSACPDPSPYLLPNLELADRFIPGGTVMRLSGEQLDPSIMAGRLYDSASRLYMDDVDGPTDVVWGGPSHTGDFRERYRILGPEDEDPRRTESGEALVERLGYEEGECCLFGVVKARGELRCRFYNDELPGCGSLLVDEDTIQTEVGLLLNHLTAGLEKGRPIDPAKLIIVHRPPIHVDGVTVPSEKRLFGRKSLRGLLYLAADKITGHSINHPQ